MKKPKQKKIIYDTFRCNTSGRTETLNDILKGIKSVLASKNGFQRYIQDYSLSTKKSSFKSPGITEYPLLKTQSSFLIPIQKEKEEKTKYKTMDRTIKYRKNKTQQLLLPNSLVRNNYNSLYYEKFNKRFVQFLRFKTDSINMAIMRKLNEKRFKRYNSLFLDFFNKWNGNNNSLYSSSYIYTKKKNYFSFDNDNKKEIKDNNSKFPDFKMKERFHGLNYDENEIFNTNYDKFILSKINDIKTNRIKNYLNEIESSFEDVKGKEIQLKLKSIKLNFYPQINNENDDDNSFYIYLPLSYVFLFYYNDFNYFLRILMSIIYFENDFKNVIFNDEELYNLLKEIKTKIKEKVKFNEKKNNGEEEKDYDYLSSFRKPKKSIDKNTFLKGNNPLDKDFRKTYSKHNPFVNKLFSNKSNKSDNKKIKIIHSNIKLRKKLKEQNNHEENLNKDNVENNNSLNDNFYNEYYFMWETPEITYKVKMEMPKIYFLYEGIEFKIVTYSDKNLFLYLYKNNFVNWDFYVLNYILSIKTFRKIISKSLSLNKDFLTSLSNSQEKNYKTISTNKTLDNSFNFVDDEDDDKNKNKNIFLVNKKIYNQMSENNEFYIFFYTDSNLNNYIIHFYSYHLKIEYKRLNPKLKWEFFLNFKQMRNLIKVTKYERLNSFLPKIVNTNFENGFLNINFNVFDENFNYKILESNKTKSSSQKKSNEMHIEVNKPYVEIEKVFNDNEKLIKKELENKFLEKINEKKMYDWSNQLLELIEKYLKSSKKSMNKMEYLKNKYFNIDDNEDEDNNINSRNKFKRKRKQKLTYAGKKSIKNIDEFNIESLKVLKSHED